MIPDTLVQPGTTLRLSDYDPDHRGGRRKRDAEVGEKRAADLRAAYELQERLYAEGRQSLLIILQAMDAGGKDGTIKHVMRGFNPQGCRVMSFKAPSDDELARDFLWRVHQQVPRRGLITVFNRSHYEDVLIVRVRNLFPEEVWRPRYEQINAFEKLLAETGTRVLKLFLHISREEQRERLQSRLDDPAKHWKFDPGDLKDRVLWDDYQAAYEEALTRCSTPWAPWHVIPANRKWYRNLVVADLVARTLREMDPQWPPAPEGLDSMVIP